MGTNDGTVVVDAQRESMPETEWSGVIVTGSGASVLDKDPWIRACADFVERAARRGTAIYGVCFGHQLLAQTFGGKVERCARGWELGTVPVRLTAEGVGDPLFAGMPATFVAQQSHRDVVAELPPGAVRLAENEHAAVQAFRFGDRIWATQFHPEFTRPLMRDMVESLAPNFSPEEFPDRPPHQPPRDWLLATLAETPEAERCLKNFARHVLVWLLFLSVGFTACLGSKNGATLFNPRTHATARCDLMREDMVEKCIEAAEKRGYVRLEALTPQQRVDLERRGFVSFEELTPEQSDELGRRSPKPKPSGASLP
jgi:GMP synthase (glutamine-hydrolysing)